MGNDLRSLWRKSKGMFILYYNSGIAVSFLKGIQYFLQSMDFGSVHCHTSGTWIKKNCNFPFCWLTSAFHLAAHFFCCCCYASYITPIICAQKSMISIIPQISEGQGTRIATVILLPIIEFTSTLPLMVKYCYLASGIPEFCARDAQFFLLIPACSGIHY